MLNGNIIQTSFSYITVTIIEIKDDELITNIYRYNRLIGSGNWCAKTGICKFLLLEPFSYIRNMDDFYLILN